MSSLALSSAEEAAIDKNLEGMLSWAQTRKHEAEQLAMDASRLLSCTTDRVDRLSRQGFFTRCWSRFNGDAASAERANTGDLIQMQKVSLRYLNMLQEQQLLMAHSMLSLKNNLLSLAVKEEETRQLIALLAGRTLERFEKLESRVDQLEVSTNLQGWLLTLEDREYDEKFPTEFMRMFRVINDFYTIKNDGWNYSDLMFMRKALRSVGINPKKKISLDCFIDSLVDEIQQDCVGFPAYAEAICQFTPQGVANYSRYAIENISSPVFTTLHGLKIQFVDRLDIVEELQDEMNISAGEALKRLLRRSISGLNVNLKYELPLAETAIDILGGMRLAARLAVPLEAQIVVGDTSLGTINIQQKPLDELGEKLLDLKKYVAELVNLRQEIDRSVAQSVSEVRAEFSYENVRTNTEEALAYLVAQKSCACDVLKSWFEVISKIKSFVLLESHVEHYPPSLYCEYSKEDLLRIIERAVGLSAIVKKLSIFLQKTTHLLELIGNNRGFNFAYFSDSEKNILELSFLCAKHTKHVLNFSLFDYVILQDVEPLLDQVCEQLTILSSSANELV